MRPSRNERSLRLPRLLCASAVKNDLEHEFEQRLPLVSSAKG
jgi:hypothetical protein